MTTVDGLLRQRAIESLIADWREGTAGMTETERAVFLAQSLDLAARGAQREKASQQAWSRINFQLTLAQMARQAVRDAARGGAA